MSRIAQKAMGNPFYTARMDAAKRKSELASRESITAYTGIDRTRLGRIETGEQTAFPEEVLRLAQLYNAPELMNHYCVTCCPIGHKTMQQVEVVSLERIALQLNAQAKRIDAARDELLTVAADGQITPEERPAIESIAHTMMDAKASIDCMLIWYAKFVKGDLDLSQEG